MNTTIRNGVATLGGPHDPATAAHPGVARSAGAGRATDSDWPAFVFITTDDGAGWVPERHLDTSSNPAVVITAYDTTELATAAGEELTLLERDDPPPVALHAHSSQPFYRARSSQVRRPRRRGCNLAGRPTSAPSTSRGRD